MRRNLHLAIASAKNDQRFCIILISERVRGELELIKNVGVGVRRVINHEAECETRFVIKRCEK
jgi:hypothetical protein